MSKLESELRRRLERSEPIEAVMRWYLKRVIADKLDWKDSSAFELQFMKMIGNAYHKWKRLRIN